MTDLATLSAKKLNEVIARRDAHWSKTLNASIAAGMGQMRFSDIVECAKGSALLHRTKLAQDYLNARHDWKVARDELDARMAYQGNDRPIKRA